MAKFLVINYFCCYFNVKDKLNANRSNSTCSLVFRYFEVSDRDRDRRSVSVSYAPAHWSTMAKKRSNWKMSSHAPCCWLHGWRQGAWQGALHLAPGLLPVARVTMLCALLLLSTLVRQSEYSFKIFRLLHVTCRHYSPSSKVVIRYISVKVCVENKYILGHELLTFFCQLYIIIFSLLNV